MRHDVCRRFRHLRSFGVVKREILEFRKECYARVQNLKLCGEHFNGDGAARGVAFGRLGFGSCRAGAALRTGLAPALALRRLAVGRVNDIARFVALELIRRQVRRLYSRVIDRCGFASGSGSGFGWGFGSGSGNGSGFGAGSGSGSAGFAVLILRASFSSISRIVAIS